MQILDINQKDYVRIFKNYKLFGCHIFFCLQDLFLLKNHGLLSLRRSINNKKRTLFCFESYFFFSNNCSYSAYRSHNYRFCYLKKKPLLYQKLKICSENCHDTTSLRLICRCANPLQKFGEKHDATTRMRHKSTKNAVNL